MTTHPRTVAQIKRHRTAKLARLVTRAVYLHRKKQDEKMYNLICEEFVQLGGVYIKFLQGVLLRSEVMQRWHSPDRLNIFENLDSEPLDIGAILRHELGPKINQIALVQPQAFAAGSFGQVYFGQHINGKPIVIKVLRPMIRELLRYDLRLLGTFSRRFYLKLYKNMQIQVDEALREFRDTTLRETDYAEEARFAHELYIAYKDHPKFIIPETFLDICTSNIIVQEYMEGISVAQLVKLHEQGVEPKTYVEEQIGSDLDVQLTTLGFEMMNGMFNLPRIQGDPHPGNIRLLSDNRVGLIDFGISARTPADKASFLAMVEQFAHLYSGTQSVGALFEQFIRFFVSDLYRALKKLSTLPAVQAVSNADFTKEIGKIAQETFAKVVGTDDLKPMLEDGSFLKSINKIINRGNRFGLVVKLEGAELLRAAQTYTTLVESLGRRQQVLPTVFKRTVEQVRHDHPDLINDMGDGMGFGEALEVVSNWLERVAERDPALFQQLTNRIRFGRKSAKRPAEEGEVIDPMEAGGTPV